MDLLADLNEPQRRAVTHMAGPLLVLAGAGSGKTRVITRRVAYLIQQGVAPENILALTFTNKAAGEMCRRIEQLGACHGATVCTFHSLCARLLRRFAAEADVRKDFLIYDREDQLKLTKQIMAQLDLKTANLPVAGIHGTISRAKNDLQTPDQFAQKDENFYARTVAEVYRHYERALAANNALDFDDLLLRMACLMRDRPDVRQTLCSQYRHILIDEYQDTNRTQYVIVHGIAMDHENICATGDPDQSIYAWRGADIRNILEFEADYPNATVVRLEENYRSTKPILAGASRLISHNRMRKEKALWTARPGGADVAVVFCDDEHAESQQVARRVAEARTAGFSYGDMAVLYRVNSLSRVMEQALLRSGIPYRVARGVEFYNRKEVKDVLAYLRLIVNPADDLSCMRAINTPPRGIGATTIKRVQDLATRRGISLLAACREPAEASLSAAAGKKVAAFGSLIADLAGSLDQPVRQIIEDTVSKMGLQEALQDTDADQQARANVDELISAAAEFDAAADLGPGDSSGLTEFLQQVSLVSDVDHMEGSEGAVTLMTLHAAKGLEFPVVFIIGFEEGLLPFSRIDEPDRSEAMTPAQQVEEERRLAFVGMTRAKDQLTLLSARYRMVRGRATRQAASTFLNQIGTDGIRIEDLTTQDPEPPEPGRGGPRGGFYADTQERAIIEAAADSHLLPPEYEYLAPGSMVRHPKFGLGRVVELTQPWPDTRAVIRFEQWGTKKIVLAMTSVELIGTRR